MRLEQERFRSIDRGSAPDGIPLGVDTNPPGRSSTLRDEPSGSDSNEWNPIDTSGEAYRFYRHSGEERIENNRESREEEAPRKTYVQKPDGFEPFINQEPQENNLFVNNYGGNYAQRMELNRRGVERALKIAHLADGEKVFLTTLAPSRSRSEVQGNELAAKRFLLFERKTQKVEEENPYKRVVSVPEGWRIEINDQRITEELMEKRLSGERLQRAFINRFNGQLKDALIECVWREKCSSEKDEHFERKRCQSLYYGALESLLLSPIAFVDPLFYVIFNPIAVSLCYGVYNFLEAKESSTSSRKIDHPLEYFAPPVEIDKVGRTLAYLAGKGRRLVREVQEEK